jgi:hypothetical protein
MSCLFTYFLASTFRIGISIVNAIRDYHFDDELFEFASGCEMLHKQEKRIGNESSDAALHNVIPRTESEFQRSQRIEERLRVAIVTAEKALRGGVYTVTKKN